MIDSITGKIVHKTPTYTRLDVNGVGYGLNIPLSTYKSLESIGKDTKLLTYLYVREDTMRLYGFKTEEEMEVFKLLISVTKVGPRLALGVLSNLSPEELKKAIMENDISKLNGTPGIGKKTAQRIIIDLKEKISSRVEIPEKVLTTEETFLIEEGIRALISLGCDKKEALKAVKTAYTNVKDKKVGLEELVKDALKQL